MSGMVDEVVDYRKGVKVHEYLAAKGMFDAVVDCYGSQRCMGIVRGF